MGKTTAHIEVDSRSHDAVNCSMRPSFEMLLEMDKIRFIRVYQGDLTFRREKIRQCHVGPVRAWNNWGILATQPVGRRIHKGEISGKCATRNFVVVVGVTPTADAANRIWIPEVAILEIRCICHKPN